MNVPRELRYTRTHEWIRFENGLATVGITDFAQQQLSDLTYVELPEPEDQVGAQDEVGVVESVKAASDLYAPCDGVVVEVNRELQDHPEQVNADPYGAGWLFCLRPTNPDDIDSLLDAEQYDELLPETED